MKANTMKEIYDYFAMYEYYSPEVVVLCKSKAEYLWLKDYWEISEPISDKNYFMQLIDTYGIVFFYDDEERCYTDCETEETVLVSGPFMDWQTLDWFDHINNNSYIIVDLDTYKKYQNVYL